MVFLAIVGALLLIGEAVQYERLALTDPVLYSKFVTCLGIAFAVARWRSSTLTGSDQAFVEFEEVPPPAIQGLGLHRDGVLPL